MSKLKQKHQHNVSAAIADREVARDDLFRQLMAMPPEERAKQSPALFARLTQAQLLRLVGGNPDDPIKVTSAHSSPPSRLKKPVQRAIKIRSPLLSALASGMLIAFIGSGVAIISLLFGPDIATAFAKPPIRSVYAAQWPACPRLDTHSDGCVYRVQAALTWEAAARFLLMPETALRASNPSVEALSQNMPIIIWRGRGTLAR